MVGCTSRGIKECRKTKIERIKDTKDAIHQVKTGDQSMVVRVGPWHMTRQ